MHSAQFPKMLIAEEEQLIKIKIELLSDVKQELQRRLESAFSSDSFSEAAKAWNEERSLVVQDAIEKHLIPIGIKWIREYLKEEAEEFLVKACGDAFYAVRLLHDTQ